MAREIARFSLHDGMAFMRFIEQARIIFEGASDPFLYKSLGNPLDVLETLICYVWRGEHQLGDAAMSSHQITLSERLKAVSTALSAETLD
jgi:hypothetical protein